MAVTSICNSFKAELLQAAHCLMATSTGYTCTNTSGTQQLTGITSVAGIAVGMIASGTGIPGSTKVSAIVNPSSITLDTPTTAGVTAFSVTADPISFALIKVSPSLTYSATQTSYGSGSGTPTTANLGTDEASGTGYTAGGIALTNVTPALSGTTAVTSFSPSPSLTGATISCTAALVYNNKVRLGSSGIGVTQSTRAIGVYDFGGTQTVTSGTITFTMPANSAGTALIQLA